MKLLDYFSKKIGLDLNYFLTNGFWVYIGYAISLITGIILAYFYANYLDKTLYGQFVFVLSFFSLIGFFSLPGMGQALTLALINGFKGNYKKTLQYTFIFSLIGSLIIILASLYYLFTNQGYSSGLWILAFLFPLISCSTYYQSFFAAEKKFKRLSFINSVNFVLTCLGVATVIIFNPSLPLLVLASLGTPLIINSYLTFNQLSPKKQKTSREFIVSGFHLSVTSSVSFISKSVDKLIIGAMLPIENLAYYAIALLVPDQIFAFIRQIVPLLLPKIANLPKKNYKWVVIKSFLLAETLMLFFILVYWFISPFVFEKFFSKYLNILFLTQLYSLTLLSLPTFIFSLVFQKFKKNQFFYFQEFSFTIFLVILLLLLIPILGIEGAILAQIVTRFIYLLLSLLLFYCLE